MQARPNTSQSHDLHARDRVDLAGLSESARIAGAGAPCIEGMRCHAAEDLGMSVFSRDDEVDSREMGECGPMRRAPRWDWVGGWG
jgi:hypothetical protein